MVATDNLVLYNPSELIVVAEVFTGESYFIPLNVEVYEGTLEQFLIDNPEYQQQNNNEL